MRGRRDDQLRRGDEPEPDGEEWVEWGGQLMWVAGWTEGGAPFGLSYEEWRRAERANERRAGWARALSVLEELARVRSGPDVVVEVGRVVKIGEGLSRDVFGAQVSIRPDPEKVWYREAIARPRGEGPPPEEALALIRRVLKLACAT